MIFDKVNNKDKEAMHGDKRIETSKCDSLFVVAPHNHGSHNGSLPGYYDLLKEMGVDYWQIHDRA